MVNKKTTVQVSSVGADGEQPLCKNTNQTIANPQQQINVQAVKTPEQSGKKRL